jgi:orotidine-5'-phosphate decarboxylase
MPFLVPGIGAQGGDIQAAVIGGIGQHGAGMIISSSRAVLYASSGTDFARSARQVALRTRDEINNYRHAVIAGSTI